MEKRADVGEKGLEQRRRPRKHDSRHRHNERDSQGEGPRGRNGRGMGRRGCDVSKPGGVIRNLVKATNIL